MRHEVSEESLSSWKRTGNVITEEIPGPSTTRHPIRLPFSDTYVKIILQAHNEFGYSQESVLVIRAVKGDLGALQSVGSSAANRLIGEVVQSQRRPLLGPSPG